MTPPILFSEFTPTSDFQVAGNYVFLVIRRAGEVRQIVKVPKRAMVKAGKQIQERRRTA